MSRQSFGQGQRVSGHDKIFLCHDLVGQDKSFLSRYNVFMLRQSWQWWRGFMSRQSVAKVKIFCVATKKLCCNMVGQVGNIYITT